MNPIVRRRPAIPCHVFLVLLLFVSLLPSAVAESAEPLVLRQTVSLTPGDVLIRRHQGVDFVSLKGGATVAPDGSPDLPALPVTFLLPEDMAIESVSTSAIETHVFWGSFRVSTVRTKSSDGQFSPEAAQPPVVGGDGFYPAVTATVGAPGRMRGRALGSVVVTPFRYRADDGRLEMMTRLELEIRLQPITRDKRFDFVPLRQEPWADAMFGKLVERLAVNGATGDRPAVGRGGLKPLINSGSPFAPTFRPSVNGSAVEMVIITDDAMAAEFQRLADWKTSSGIPAVVRTVSWIQDNYPNGVDTQETIRNFIRDAAQKWGTVWVLLGGDTDIIPARYGRTLFFGSENIPTDLYYQCVDGTWNADGDGQFGEGWSSVSVPGDNADMYPEVWIGRTSTKSAAEAEAVVDKILAYEVTPLRNGYQKGLLALAEVLFPQQYTPGDSILFDGAHMAEDAISYLPASMSAVKLYEHCPYVEWPTCILESRQTVIDSLNAGFGIVHHVGHGYINTMAVGEMDMALGNADADALSNGNEIFFLYAINCTSSAIDYNCIAERFLLNANGGSVASVGSTRYDFPTTGWSYQNEFYRLVFQENLREVGRADPESKLPFVPLAMSDNTHRWTQFTLIFFGDPSMPVYADAPQDLNVSRPATLTLGAGTYTVSVSDAGGAVDSARVCLNKAGDEYVVGYTDPSGQATLAFVPDSTGTFEVTVVARDHVPWRGSATVVAPASPYLYAQDQLIDDDGSGSSIGNGDGRMDAGETIELMLPLKNRGGSTTGGVTATMTSLSPYVSVTDPTSTYGTIAGGATVTPGDAIVLTVSRLAPDRTEAPVQLTYVSGVTTIQENILLYIHAPVFEWYRQVARDTAGNGNSDGVIAPAEDVTLLVRLRNEGLGQAQSVAAVLRSTDPVFTISDSTVSFGTIAGGTRAVSAPAGDTFRFQMSDTTGLAASAHRLQVSLYDTYSPATAVATFTIDPAGPKLAPSNLVAAGSESSIALTFDRSNTPDVLGYNIYRGLASTGPFSRVNQYTTRGTAYYNDEGLPALTLYYYKVAAQDSSGNEGPWSAAASASTTLPIHEGYPVELKSATNASVTLADVDYDGVIDILGGASEVYAIRPDGTEVYDGDGDIRTLGPLTNTGSAGFWNAPAVGDVDLDGSPEVAAVSWPAMLYLWDEFGVPRSGWPRSVNVQNLVDPNPLGSVAMADVDGDEDLELFCIVGKIIYGFHHDGSEIRDGDSNPSTIGVFKATGTAYSYGTPALADLTGDGLPEVIAGTRDGRLHVMNGVTGAELTGFPYVVASDITSSPAVGDIDNDTYPEIIFGSSIAKVYALNPDATAVSGWPQGIQLSEDLDSSPALGDLTGDGIPDVACGASNGRLFAWRSTGLIMTGWPVFIRDNAGVNVAVRSSPILVDIDNSGIPEIIVGDQKGRLHAFYANGSPVPGFPIQTGNLIEGGPAAWDLDADGLTEIVCESYDQRIYIWDTPWTFNKAASPWPMFHHDARHTGNLTEPILYQSAVPETPATVVKPFQLSQNQPNPFNPVTAIRYRIDASGRAGGLLPVRLEVFSTTGRLVKVLVDRPMPGGDFEVRWDGTDESGGAAPSGVYYYRMSTPLGVENRKMALVR